MADADWGWKKRTSDSVNAKDLYDFYKTHKLASDYWKRFGQPYYQPYYASRTAVPAYSYQAYSYGLPKANSVKAQRTSNPNKEKQYSYHSMADMDWGWKRKRSGNEQVYVDDYEIPQKKNVASLARNDALYGQDDDSNDEGW